MSGSGTLEQASHNVDTRWEYGQDCTNFVPKAPYHGGGTKTRHGGRRRDRAWLTGVSKLRLLQCGVGCDWR